MSGYMGTSPKRILRGCIEIPTEEILTYVETEDTSFSTDPIKTYYEKVDGSYVETEDASMDPNKTYYEIHYHYKSVLKKIKKAWVGNSNKVPELVLTQKDSNYYHHDYGEFEKSIEYDVSYELYDYSFVGYSEVYIQRTYYRYGSPGNYRWNHDNNFGGIGSIQDGDLGYYLSAQTEANNYIAVQFFRRGQIASDLSVPYCNVALVRPYSGNTQFFYLRRSAPSYSMRYLSIPKDDSTYSISFYNFGNATLIEGWYLDPDPTVQHGQTLHVFRSSGGHSFYEIKYSDYRYYNSTTRTYVNYPYFYAEIVNTGTGPSMPSGVTIKPGYICAADGENPNRNGYFYLFSGSKYYKLINNNGTFEWTAGEDLPEYITFENDNDTIILFNNKVHVFLENTRKHYSFDGTNWQTHDDLPIVFDSYSRVGIIDFNNILGLYSKDIVYQYTEQNGWTAGNISYSNFYDVPYYQKYSSAIRYNSKLHLLGGCDSRHSKHYFWNGNSWTKVTDILGDLDYTETNPVVFDNKIVLLESTDSHMLTVLTYDETNGWVKDYSYDTQLITRQMTSFSSVVYHDKIYIFSTYRSYGSGGLYYKYCYSFDFTNGITVESTPSSSVTFVSAVVYNDKIYLASVDSTGSFAHLDLYSYDGNDYTYVSRLPILICPGSGYGAKLLSYDGKLYVVFNEYGGSSSAIHYVHEYLYDEENDEWVEEDLSKYEIKDYSTGNKYKDGDKLTIPIGYSTVFFRNFLYIMNHTTIIEFNNGNVFN